MEQYRNMKTDEIVPEEDAQNYVMDKLGITIKPLGNSGAFTLDQTQFLIEFTEWYFSGEWIKERAVNEDNEVEDYDAVMEDRRYQDALEKKWGLI